MTFWKMFRKPKLNTRKHFTNINLSSDNIENLYTSAEQTLFIFCERRSSQEFKRRMKLYIALALLAVLVSVHSKPLLTDQDEEELARINGFKSKFFQILNTAGCALQKIGRRDKPSYEVDIEGFNLRRILQGFVNCLPPTPRRQPDYMNSAEEELNEMLQKMALELEEEVAAVEEDSEEEVAEKQFSPSLVLSFLPAILDKLKG